MYFLSIVTLSFSTFLFNKAPWAQLFLYKKNGEKRRKWSTTVAYSDLWKRRNELFDRKNWRLYLISLSTSFFFFFIFYTPVCIPLFFLHYHLFIETDKKKKKVKSWIEEKKRKNYIPHARTKTQRQWLSRKTHIVSRIINYF